MCWDGGPADSSETVWSRAGLRDVRWGPTYSNKSEQLSATRQTPEAPLPWGDVFIPHSLLTCSQEGELGVAWGPPG